MKHADEEGVVEIDLYQATTEKDAAKESLVSNATHKCPTKSFASGVGTSSVVNRSEGGASSPTSSQNYTLLQSFLNCICCMRRSGGFQEIDSGAAGGVTMVPMAGSASMFSSMISSTKAERATLKEQQR